MSGFAADHQGAEVRTSPNFGPRRASTGAGARSGARSGASSGDGPDMIVLHYTGMESGLAAENWLCMPESQVSAHYIVHEDGRIVQMVREQDRAWHAGAGSWRGDTDVNSRSIGIEIVNGGADFGSPAFPRRQIAAVISLCRGIIARHGIAPEMVVGHSDTAPGRKIDPGEKFPWGLLAARGIGHWVPPSPIMPGDEGLDSGARDSRVREMQAGLRAYGYGVEITGELDVATMFAVKAFQRHFRPSRVDGRIDASTAATLKALQAALSARPAPGDLS